MTQPSGTDPSRCPLCGEPNDCVMNNQQPGQTCWCRETTFSKTLLDKIPPAAKNKACICRRCAQSRPPSASR